MASKPKNRNGTSEVFAVRLPHGALEAIRQMASDRGLPPATVARQILTDAAQTAKSP